MFDLDCALGLFFLAYYSATNDKKEEESKEIINRRGDGRGRQLEILGKKLDKNILVVVNEYKIFI